MQTLRKLFFKKFLKEWAIISATSFVVMALILIGHNSVPPLITFIGLGYIVFGPITHATFTNNDFQENLDWLINYQYNRKQLIKFYLSTQTIKLFLVTCTYSVYFLVFALAQKAIEESSKISAKDKGIAADFIEFTSSWAGISIVYFIFLAAIYAVYFASLFKANSEIIRRHNITKQTNKIHNNFVDSIKNVKEWDSRHYIVAFWVSASSFILFDIELEALHALVFLSGFVGFASVQIFNRKFKVFSLNKARSFSFALCLLLAIPHLAFYFGSISDINNRKKNLNARISSLEYISPHYTIGYKVLAGMYKKAKTCKQFGKLSSYAGAKGLEPKFFIRSNIDYCQFYNSVRYYNLRSNSNKYTPQLIVMIQKYILDNSLEEHKQIKLAAALSHKKMSRRYVNSLMDNDSVFKKYLALKLAKKSFGYRKYKTFVKAHYEELPNSIKKLGSVKRAIASISREVKDKKKNKDYFNYDNY